MWVIIGTNTLLKFYNLKGDTAVEVDGLNYFIKERGHVPEIKFDHNFAVSKLLENGFPLFINKADARKEAVFTGLTGFKYLQLNPSILKIS
tara:strand:+ start:1139 stop:1411 length:273 start_codon:yes stop_codon:yes gene_type:complete